MLPTSIEIIHDLENHEHIVCSSQNDHHIHIEDLDCNEFQIVRREDKL